MATETQPLIKERTEACRALFRKFLEKYPADEWIENRQADFQLWSIGFQASASGKASLDHKLRDFPQIRDFICDHIDGLNEILQRHLDPAEYNSNLNIGEVGDEDDEDEEDDTGLFDPRSDLFSETRTVVKILLQGLERISIRQRQETRDRDENGAIRHLD
jgi:hypothetical protein